MSTASDVLGAVKKIFLLDDNMQRLKRDVEQLGNRLSEHEHRLIRIETLVELSSRPQPRLIMPGE